MRSDSYPVQLSARALTTFRTIPCQQIEPEVNCNTCAASCCRLEVVLISDTGVPARFIETDQWGAMTMARLDDGWCAALDRATMSCSIYKNRPWVCREFEMGGSDCLSERETIYVDVCR